MADDDPSGSAAAADAAAAAAASRDYDEDEADDNDIDDDDVVDPDDTEGAGEEAEEADEEAAAGELARLLGALAAGVRAVQNLPTKKINDDDEGDDDNVDDDFEFERSFPEFATGLQVARSTLAHTLVGALEAAAADGGDDSNEELEELLALLKDDDGDDGAASALIDRPALWEKCADACDGLVDRVEAALERLSSSSAGGESEGFAAESQSTLTDLRKWSDRARDKSQKSFGMLMDGLVDMEKPQLTYRMRVQNGRTEPFVPPLGVGVGGGSDPPSLDLEAGPGLEGRFGDGTLRQVRALPRNLVAPAFHVPHPYRAEIERFEYRPDQLVATDKPRTKMIQVEAHLEAEWIDTEAALEGLANELEAEAVSGVALDLEAHSYRSFSGFVCLMQLSFRTKSQEGGDDDDGDVFGDDGRIRNYLIDAIALRECMNQHLQPCLADPSIVKILHGADSDVVWLQRDFGLYIVNLFDTGRAARLLGLSSAGYAHLLQKYAGIAADKSHQLADWRRRPLPEDMRQYAIQDTHYLLDVYERIRYDLYKKGGEALMREVLDVSRQVCLFRYAVEPFNPDGYKVLLKSRGGGGGGRRGGGKGKNKKVTVTQFNELQDRILRRLWDWRDRVAREEDESLAFVCANRSLVRIALAGQSTTSLRALQSLLNPVPPLVLQHSQQILDITKREVQQQQQDQQEQHDDEEEEEEEEEVNNQEDEDEEIATTASASQQQQQQPVGAPSSAFFKPASSSSGGGGNSNKDANTALRRSGMMSPVLGTEALYKQAGWMSPVERERVAAAAGGGVSILDETTTSADEDDPPPSPSEKPKRLLSVHESNKHYSSRRAAGTRNINLSSPSRTADGMGTVRASREHSQSPSARSTTTISVEAEAKWAIRNSRFAKQTLPAVLGLVTPTIDVDDDEATSAIGGFSAPTPRGIVDGGGTADGSMDEEDFPIPRSMREIYKISNRNRRNKKAGSPTPERGVTPTSEKEREELAQAEALLREKGLLATPYFDDGGTPGKRQRTKTLSGRESEESIPQETSVSAASRDDDLAVIKNVGWLQPGAAEGGSGFSGVAGQPNEGAFGFNYAAVGAIGALEPAQSQNPFFAGAALAGGPTAQAFAKPEGQRPKKGNTGRQRNRRERPKKKEDGRTQAYRNR